MPAVSMGQGWVWQNIFPGSLSLLSGNEKVEIIEYNGSLYAGVGEGNKSQVFRYLGSSNWEQVNADGFGIDVELGVTSMEEYNGYLYVGDRYVLGGGYVLRTQAQGGPPYTDWVDVNITGFGDVNNEQISDLKSFNGYLYAATKNSVTGTEVWRTQAVGGPPYTDWTQVNTDGFSDLSNEDAPFFGKHDGYLYVSTSKTFGGGEVWRTSNGTSWSQVGGDGLGNNANTSITSFSTFNNSLFAGSLNLSGGNLFRSANGSSWSNISTDGFGNSNNDAVNPLINIGNYLYVGTENNSQGTGIYRTSNDSSFYRTNEFGFGSGSYSSFQALEVYNNLYVNAGSVSGGEIWVDQPPVVSNVDASQNSGDRNKINISFRANDPDNADNLKARVEYNIGSGWQKATIMVNDQETYASHGDPKVSNAADYQVGNTQGYIITSSGINTINTVWDYSIDEPNLNSSSVRVRVILDDQILEGEYLLSGLFSITSNAQVTLTKSFSVAGPGPAPQIDNTDQAQIAALSSFMQNIGGGIIANFNFEKIFGIKLFFEGQLLLTFLLLIILLVLLFNKYIGLENLQNNYKTSILAVVFILSLNSFGILSLFYLVQPMSASPFDVYPRDTITYRVEYENLYNQDIHDLYVVDEIPAYSTYKNGTLSLNSNTLTDALDLDVGDFNISNQNKITVFVGTVTANSSGYVEFQVEVNANAPMDGRIKNQARGAYNPGNISIASNITENIVIATGSISGKVFYDSNKDKVVSPGEWGIENAVVKLYEDSDQNNLLDPAIDYLVGVNQTNSNGDYSFGGLSARYYLIYVEGYSLPQNYLLTSDNNPGQAVLSVSDQQYINADFGYVDQPQLPTTPTTPTAPIIPPTTATTPEPILETPPDLEENDEELEIIRDREDLRDSDEEKIIQSQEPERIPEKEEKKTLISEPEKISTESKKNVFNSMLYYSLPVITVAGLINLLTAVPISSLLNYLYYLFQLITQPFLLLSREKKKRLGVIYNAMTKMPIDLALVRLFDKDTGKLVETRVTNEKGQYLFVVEKDKRYYLEAKKENYIFPSKYLNFIPDDIDYKNIYYGDTINAASEDNEAGKISKNIPMDMENGYSLSTSSSQKIIDTKIKKIDDLRLQTENERVNENKKVRRYFTFRKINKVIAYIGPVFALLTFMLNPVLITFILLLVHIILLLLFRRLAQTDKIKSWGKLFDIDSKKGIANSVIRLFDRKYGKLLLTTLSKSDGRYGFMAGRNSYLLSGYKENYQMPRGKVEIISKDNGIVNQDIGLERDENI